MLIGMWGYIDVVALACAVAALPLFIGLRRSNILDRNNLFGAILLCFAALLHGGFEVLLRSSPHESFAGYLRGGSGERPAMAILLSDTDCPPTAPLKRIPGAYSCSRPSATECRSHSGIHQTASISSAIIVHGTTESHELTPSPAPERTGSQPGTGNPMRKAYSGMRSKEAAD